MKARKQRRGRSYASPGRNRVALTRAPIVCLALVSWILGGTGCTEHKTAPVVTGTANRNSVAAYLGNAERQSETDDQRREIQKALENMLQMTPSQLKSQRYADYEGKQGSWSASQ